MILSPLSSAVPIISKSMMTNDGIQKMFTSSEKNGITVLISDSSGVTLSNTIYEQDLDMTPVWVEKETFTKISLPGYAFTTEVGKPQLPMLSKWVVVPDTGDITLEILGSSYSVLTGDTIYPVPKQVIKKDSQGMSYPEEEFTIENWFFLRIFLLF